MTASTSAVGMAIRSLLRGLARVHTIVVATGGSATTDGGPRTAGRGRRLRRQRRREAWAGALSDAGFDPGQPTAWLAEGLLMYVSGQVEQHGGREQSGIPEATNRPNGTADPSHGELASTYRRDEHHLTGRRP